MAVTLEELAVNFTTTGEDRLLAVLERIEIKTGSIAQQMGGMNRSAAVAGAGVERFANTAHAGFERVEHRLKHMALHFGIMLPALMDNSQGAVHKLANSLGGLGLMMGGLAGYTLAFIGVAGAQFLHFLEEAKKKMEEHTGALDALRVKLAQGPTGGTPMDLNFAKVELAEIEEQINEKIDLAQKLAQYDKSREAAEATVRSSEKNKWFGKDLFARKDELLRQMGGGTETIARATDDATRAEEKNSAAVRQNIREQQTQMAIETMVIAQKREQTKMIYASADALQALDADYKARSATLQEVQRHESALVDLEQKKKDAMATAARAGGSDPASVAARKAAEASVRAIDSQIAAENTRTISRRKNIAAERALTDDEIEALKTKRRLEAESEFDRKRDATFDSAMEDAAERGRSLAVLKAEVGARRDGALAAEDAAHAQTVLNAAEQLHNQLIDDGVLGADAMVQAMVDDMNTTYDLTKAKRALADSESTRFSQDSQQIALDQQSQLAAAGSVKAHDTLTVAFARLNAEREESNRLKEAGLALDAETIRRAGDLAAATASQSITLTKQADSIAKVVALAQTGLEAAFTPGGGMQKAFAAMSEQFGGYLEQLGANGLKAALITNKMFAAIFSGSPQGIALSLALIAAGAAIKGRTNIGGGGGGGGGDAGSWSGGSSGLHSYQTINPVRSSLPGGTQAPSAQASVTVNATILGTDSPKAGRELLEMIAIAQRRGSTFG